MLRAGPPWLIEFCLLGLSSLLLLPCQVCLPTSHTNQQLHPFNAFKILFQLSVTNRERMTTKWGGGGRVTPSGTALVRVDLGPREPPFPHLGPRQEANLSPLEFFKHESGMNPVSPQFHKAQARVSEGFSEIPLLGLRGLGRSHSTPSTLQKPQEQHSSLHWRPSPWGVVPVWCFGSPSQGLRGRSSPSL